MRKSLGQKIQRPKKSRSCCSIKTLLRNFWQALDMPLINREIELVLTWSENCVLTNIKLQAARDANLPILL